MRNTMIPVIITCLILTGLITGCSGDPVNPGVTDGPSPTVSSAVEESGNIRSNLGYYEITVDTETGEAEIIPVRIADMHLNVTMIINNQMGVSIAGVPGESDPPNGLIVLDITLSHPIPNDQFTGFDVMGILMAPGTLMVGDLVFSDADETRLTNADGYTRWWNPTEFTSPGFFGYTQGNLAKTPASALTATVNPYKYFANALWPESAMTLVYAEPLDADNGRGVFSAGGENTRRYRIQFEMNPGPQIKFGYAIGASWAPPTIKPPSAVPDDFPMNANQPEPFYLGSSIKANSLYYDSESGQGGGVFRLQVNVHDWQGMEAGNIAGQVESVTVYAPGLIGWGADAAFVDETVYRAAYMTDLISGTDPSKAGETVIIMAAESKWGPSYDQGFGPAPSDNITTFQSFLVDVVDPECGPDTNDGFSEAIDLDLENPTVDQMCAPDDYRDFFELNLPFGSMITGELTLYCNPEPTKFGIYDETEALITEVDVSGGTATLDLGALGIMPGTYYLRVLTQTSGQAFLYMIVPELEITDITPNAVEVTPDDLYFKPLWVDGYGDLAIAAGTNRLRIYDYSTDPTNPTQLSQVEISNWREPGFAYPYIYVASYASPSVISMIDISNPSAPVVHEGIMDASDLVWTIDAEPGYLYLCTDLGPVDIYDIGTDPTAPVLLSTIPGSEKYLISEILHNPTGPESWIVFSSYTYYLAVYDVTDKGSPFVFGTVSGAATSVMRDFAVIDDVLFFLLENLGTTNLWSYYVSTSGFSFGDLVAVVPEANLLDTGGGYAFATSKTRFSKVDVSDPTNLGTPLNYTFDEAWINDMDVEGDHILHALGAAGLRYVTTGVADYGRTIGLGEAGQIAVDGDYLYAIDSYYIYYAIKSVNISDPAAAYLEGELLVDYSPSQLAVNGGRMVAYSADGDHLLSIDCTDPANMSVGNDVVAADYVPAMGMTDNALFVGYFSGNIEVFGFSTWPVLTSLTTIPGTHLAEGFLFKDNVMYVEAGGEILVYSITVPSMPAFMDTYIPVQGSRKMAINGDYLYITTMDYVEIVDISNPVDPVFVATISHPDAPHTEYIAAVDQFVIAQPYYTTPPPVIRVWPPDEPVVVGPLYGAEYATKPNQVLVHNGYYYERHTDVSLRIWDLYQ